jgi:excisionase family DNA binding protein
MKNGTAVKESTDERMIVTMTIADLREIVRQELQAVSTTNGQPEKLLLDTEEAAQFLNVPPTWLASMAREGKIKSIKLGHYVRFARADLEAFILEMKDRGQDS